MKQWAIEQPPALTYEHLGVRLCSLQTCFKIPPFPLFFHPPILSLPSQFLSQFLSQFPSQFPILPLSSPPPPPFPSSYPFLSSPLLPLSILSLLSSPPPVEDHFNANVQLRRTSAKDVKIAQQAQKEEVQEFRLKERQRLASLKERYTKTLFSSIVTCKCENQIV